MPCETEALKTRDVEDIPYIALWQKDLEYIGSGAKGGGRSCSPQESRDMSRRAQGVVGGGGRDHGEIHRERLLSNSEQDEEDRHMSKSRSYRKIKFEQ